MWERQVGKRIEKLRTERGLSRAQFGNMVGVSQQYIGRLERGSHNITGAMIVRICKAIGVSSDYIVFGTIDPADVSETLSGYSHEQIQITLEIAMKVAQFLSTANGNNLLIQEVLRRQN